MKTICIDVDSTLNDHWRRIAEWAKGSGRCLTAEFHRATWTEDRPLPGAVQATQDFKSVADARIVILTARDWDMPDGKNTKTWLDRYNFWYDHVKVVGSGSMKPFYLRDRKIDLFVDDFTAGQESRCPKLDVRIYEACVKTGVPVEPFRNNWPEIVDRWLRNWGLEE